MRKLTPGEIRSTVAKIRAKYKDYTYKYFKPASVAEAFEERYVQALRNGLDISSFLLAEISAVEELIRPAGAGEEPLSVPPTKSLRSSAG